MTTDLTAQLHQYLTTAPSSLFAQQEVAVLAHWEGDANLLWRVAVDDQQAVVKLYLDAGQARSRRQFDGHRVFAPLGLAPQPLWADRYPHGLSHQLIVYRWSEGESIDPNAQDELFAWAEAIGMLHATPTDDVQRFSPHPVNLDFYWRIEQDSIAQIQRWLATTDLTLVKTFDEIAAATTELVQNSLPLWATATPTAVHGDLSHQHTLLERGRVTLLDWEMFGLGDPALDVARLLQREAQTLTPSQTEQWLDRYLQTVDHPTLAARIDLFQKLLEVHNIVYLLIGLQQHTAVQLDAELRDVLPFVQASLATALDRAADVLALSPPSNSAATAEEFITWLLTTTSTLLSDPT